MSEHRTHSQFPAWRAALIGIAIAGFMLVFRPFGITIANTAAFLVILGLAPLNFATILLVHLAPSRKGWIGLAQRAGAITLANIIYISLLTAGGAEIASSIKVGLVTLLVIAAVGLWNRERSLHREVLELRTRPLREESELIILRGEGDKEILRLAPDQLRFIKAGGNYIDVHFMKNGTPEKVLLRGTLANVANQAGDGTLIQCHRSYFVNLMAAQRIISEGGRMGIEFASGERVPVSRNFRAAIREAAIREDGSSRDSVIRPKALEK